MLRCSGWDVASLPGVDKRGGGCCRGRPCGGIPTAGVICLTVLLCCVSLGCQRLFECVTQGLRRRRAFNQQITIIGVEMANICGFSTCGSNIPSSTEAGPAITADAFPVIMGLCCVLVDWVISPLQSVFLKATS